MGLNLVELPPCRWRGSEKNAGNFGCFSPKLIVGRAGVPASMCLRCPYVDHSAEVNGITSTDRGENKISLPFCAHLGGEIHPSSAPDLARKYHVCRRGYGTVCACLQCQVCPERAMLIPEKTYRVVIGSSTSLHTVAFNPSIIDFRGQRLFAYRVGWGGGHIRIAVLNADFQPIYSHILDLSHPLSSGGAEDPRMFVFGGKLHLSFTGVERVESNLRVHVLVASLDDNLRVDRVWYPHYTDRNPAEKNWVFFESGGELLCVYSTSPNHQILKVRDSATLVYSTPMPGSWGGGLIRGGASPVFHRGQFYHFFHGFRQTGDSTIYSIGVLTFAAQAPYRVTALARLPIQAANQSLNPRDGHTRDKAIIFVCGALFDGRRWVISYGHHDHWCEISTFSESAIDDSLEEI